MSEIRPPPPEGRVRVERRGALMLIGIDRPAKLNGFTPEMIDQLSQAYQRFEDDADARAGWGDAMLYLLTGDEFGAKEAYRMRLVQEVVEPGRQLERAIEIAERIAAQAPLAIAATLSNGRTLIREGHPAAVAELGPIQARLLATKDAAEGLRSFRERRVAAFKGR